MMQSIQTYKVDLDYEAFLFDPHYKEGSAASEKIIREFEYIYFLVQKNPSILKNSKHYDKKYLDFLKSLGFSIPEFNPSAAEFSYWWGYHHDINIERILNSKLTSAKLAKKNNWGFHQGEIVQNIDELTAHLRNFPEEKIWIVKRPYSFSGIGHYQFSADTIDHSTLKEILTEKVLLEPAYERLFDIGTTFVIRDGIIQNHFMVENFNSISGRFKGGAGSSSVDKFKKYIFQKYSFDLSGLEAISVSIAEEYLKLGAQSNIQIDSFVYKHNNTLKIYPLVEVNYRKTMGLVIQSLAKKFSDADSTHWRIETEKSLKESALDSNWTKVSPESNYFKSYYHNFCL
jgi:hypothetical protein